MEFLQTRRSVIIAVFFIVLYTSLTLAKDATNSLDLTYIPEEEINEKFSNSTVITTNPNTGKNTVIDFYKNGTVISDTDGKIRKGLWHTDNEGRHCIRWEKKDKSNCALVMRDEDGEWVKVKDDKIIKNYESFETLNNNSNPNIKKKKKILEF